MPPKKKGKGKGGKGAKEEKSEEVARPTEPTGPSDREVYLRRELNNLTSELDRYKNKVDELRKENDVLQQEAKHIRVESHEYMSYMAKKTHKRQTMIVSLSDQNQKELNDIKLQMQQLLADYEEKKNALKATLLDKESQLTKARTEFHELAEYRELREDQLRKIKQLEREVLHMRGKHSETIQQLKSKFLQEKSEYTNESDAKIQVLATESNKKAVRCLNEHTTKIKHDNRSLRAELLELIRQSQVLNLHKQELENQKKQLLRETQYNEDIKRIRGARQKKILERLEKTKLDD